MTKIPVLELIAIFVQMFKEHWSYIWGAARKGCVDCSGAFVWAYKQFGRVIAHGSNTIARSYIKGLLPISEAKPGMAAFKIRKPGDRYYDLPAKFKKGGSAYNGDLNDYYHIGLVDDTGKYVLNAQSEKAGFTRTKLSLWGAVGYLSAVDYNGGEDMQKMYVTATSGKTVHMRKSPSKSTTIIKDLPLGTEVLAGEDINGWREIIHGDEGGYMMSQFLTTDAPGATYKVTCYGMTWAQAMKIRETCPTATMEKEA